MVEQIANPSATESAPETGRFFVIEPSLWEDAPGPGLELANMDQLLAPGAFAMEPPNGDPGQYPQRPHLVRVPSLGGAPRDFEMLASLWIVSAALKQVFESVDPQGFAFVACDYTLADGSAGTEYYLCNVVRQLDALDLGASRVKVKLDHDYETGEDVEFYSILGGARLRFRADLVGGAHVFRQARLRTGPVCDRVLFDAVNAAGLGGVEFRDVADL
ncbi:hypothetical protein ABIE09_002028 [Lysobacter enzymogenes]|uniref:imm11 family protein n=1 Tax=Lysobacter enzymogenes TaxID=69 RepID=UPI00339710F8